MAGDRAKTADLLARLQRHYIKPGETYPGGVFVPECGRNGTTGSRADALYVGFTSTSGRILVGHELKVSRADWRHELDKPGKADAWADQCHAWYVVAPSTDIVPPEELPAGWGLMVINPRSVTRLAVKVKAEVHRDRTPSWPTVRSIMARQDTLRAKAIEEIRHTARDQAREELQEQRREIASAAIDGQTRDRLEALDQLEDALGFRLSRWQDQGASVTPRRLAAAIALCRAAGGTRLPTYQREDLARALDSIRDGLGELEKQLDAWHEISGERPR